MEGLELKFTMKRNVKFAILIAAILIGTSIIATAVWMNTEPKPKQKINSYPIQSGYSFESGMQNWTTNGTDLWDPPINWSVERSTERAVDGSYSMKFYLENFNDAGKIWMEKRFSVEPNTQYQVHISYQFATADFGDLNLFHLITTVLGHNFSGREDLYYTGDTGHHTDADGFVWLNKSFESVVETDESGLLYINLGVWGSWETTRTYYIDAVNISIEKLPAVEEYPNLSGIWKLKHYNWEGNLTLAENITIIQNESILELQFELGLPVAGTIIKNTIKNPFRDTELIIHCEDFRGLGIDTIYVINETKMITELPVCETCNPSIFTRL